MLIFESFKTIFETTESDREHTHFNVKIAHYILCIPNILEAQSFWS